MQVAAYLAVAAVLTLAAMAFAAQLAGNRAALEVRRHAEEALRLNSATLQGHLEKYRHLPALAARRPDIRALAAAGFPRGEDARRILTEMQTLSGAVDTAFLRPDGSVAMSVTGLAEREVEAGAALLIAAGQGRLGRETIAGGTGRRAYAFASPVRAEGRIAGFVMVAAPLETIEQSWALSTVPIVALDREGRLVAGNLLARENETAVRAAIAGTARSELLAYSTELPLLQWQLHALEPASAIAAARSSSAAVAMLAGALASVGGLALLLRLQGARRQRRVERAAAIRLERQVRYRTRDLKAANARLEIEVEERRAAEAALRKAQGDLVQSAKLAAIGQMSAALAHEYNQPLAAIRTYADNGLKFISRENTAKAASNLERIAQLVERMAQLSKTLKSFARRPRSEIVAVQLDAVMRDALLLAGHKAAQSGVEIVIDQAEPGLAVLGGHVRLSQVLVNLISNAVDASVQAGERLVEVSVSSADGMVAVEVRDHGQGIADKDMAAIFDPFFTTKEVGEGLGLGLSIAYNIVHEFSGRLEARNAEGGGAVFRVSLPQAISAAQAAE